MKTNDELRHEMFLLRTGLGLPQIRPPMSLAGISTIANAAPSKFTLVDFIEAAEAIRHLEPPQRELKLTQEELATLKDRVSEINGWRPYGFDVTGQHAAPEFMGLRIVVLP